MIRRVGWIVVLGTLGVSTGIASEPKPETVVYTALRPANWDVYLFEAAGEEPRRLTEDSGLDYNPAFSPDGRWVVFCSERRGNPDLYRLDRQNPGPPKLLLGSSAMEDAPAFSPDGRQLAFVGSRGGNADIFLAPFDPDKGEVQGEPKNITHHARGDFNPAFSPGGNRIAFASDRDGYKAGEIYVMNSDGSEVQRLTNAPGWDGSPVWSADGESIYFYSERDGDARIYRMNADGTDQTAITPGNQTALSPAVTPDGRIALATRRQGRWQIVSVAPDGTDERVESEGPHDYWAPQYDPQSGRMICHGTRPREQERTFESSTPGPFLVNARQQVRLPDRSVRVCAVRGYFPSLNRKTGEVASDEGFHRVVISRLDGTGLREVFQRDGRRTWRPSWSKDGHWVACTVGSTFAEPNARVDLWKFRPDGNDAVNLTADSAANDAFPDFSPDGKQIVFRSGREGNHDIYLMNADGTQIRRLTDHEATDTMPAFSPAGDRIAFTSNRGGDYEVYVLNLEPDGTAGNLHRVTHSPGRDTHPKFSPDGKWLVFASERGGMNDETPLIPVFNPQPYGEIFAVRLKDGHVVRLTHNKWEDGTPTWGGPVAKIEE